MTKATDPTVPDEPERPDPQAGFIARGLRSRDEARRTGQYYSPELVVEGLQRQLEAAHARLARNRR